MTAGTFDLEPEDERPGPELPPLRPGLRRTRSEDDLVRNSRRGARFTPAAPLVDWLIAPSVYYALAVLTALAILLVRFNPYDGVDANLWPYELFHAGGLWGFHQAHAGAYLVPIVAGIVALCMRPGQTRAVVVAVAFAFPLCVLFTDYASLAPSAIALVAGVLIGAPRGRRGYLFALLLLLAGALFVPTGDGRAYESALTEAVDALFGAGGSGTLADPLIGGFGLLLLAVGVLAWIGLGGRWVPFAAGALVLGLYVWINLRSLDGVFEHWQEPAAGWSRLLWGHPIAYMLPLTGAVIEWTRAAVREA